MSPAGTRARGKPAASTTAKTAGAMPGEVSAGAMPGEVSATDAAKRLGLTAQSLGMWTRRPGAPARVDGKRVWVQWPAFARWREEELARQRVEEATKALRAQLDAHQDGNPLTRKLVADARKAEIEVELLERSAVKVEDANAVIAKLLTDLRAAILPFPRVAAPRLLGAKSVQELEQRLHALVVRLLETLSAPAFGEDTATEERAA